MNKIQSIRLRALALRSSIHNEQQLSAIELAGMSAKKTNELIDVINELTETLENLTVDNNLVVRYDETTESLNIVGGE